MKIDLFLYFILLVEKSHQQSLLRSKDYTVHELFQRGFSIFVRQLLEEEKMGLKYKRTQYWFKTNCWLQGGDGTALTHWEKRLFQNEAMTGTVNTDSPVYSRLTLALMEGNCSQPTTTFFVDFTCWYNAVSVGHKVRAPVEGHITVVFFKILTFWWPFLALSIARACAYCTYILTISFNKKGWCLCLFYFIIQT